ncbi:MAG: hypothetical protein GY851_29255, partial [bacterium]|nr:hypothetical protein [bacterium]
MNCSVGLAGGANGALVFVSLVVLTAVLVAPQKALGQGEAQRIKWTAGEWHVEFEAPISRLACEHKASGARVEGALTFSAHVKGEWKPWRVVMPRDSVKNRPALLDENGNVQGYLNVTGSGGTLRIHVVHRSAQNYPGRLTFQGTAGLGEQTFACRTRQNPESRVVQLASGSADSALNDSLFDMQSDTVLRMNGERVAIRTKERGEGQDPFSIEATALPHVAAYSALKFEVIRDYYRERYVPYYQPI